MEARRVEIAGVRETRLERFELNVGNLSPGEVVVQTLVTLVSPGTEGAAFLGLKGAGAAAGPSYPIKGVGYANVGEVVAVGSEARAAIGDVVYTMGRHASAVRIDTLRQLCVKLPKGVEPEQAVFTRLATVPMSSIRTAAARVGDRVAVVGLGLVGNLAAQVCEVGGMPTTAIDVLPFRCEVARACGLSSVLRGPSDDELEPVHQLVVEATGTNAGAVIALKLARTGGEVSLVGSPWGLGNPGISAQAILELVFARYIHMRSGWEWQVPVLEQPIGPTALMPAASIEQSTRYALGLIQQGWLHVRELLTHRLPPESVQEAYEGLVDHKDEYLGVVLDWRE